jgi:hypothetical protein
MGAGESAVVDWVSSALPLGAALLLFGIGLLVLLSALVRRLAGRWKRDAGELTERIQAALAQFEGRLTALEVEAGQYSPDLAPPYQDRIRHLQDRLHAIGNCLSSANDSLIDIPTPPLTTPVTKSAEVTYLLWSEPRARHARRSRLRAVDRELTRLDQDFAASESLLKQLRRTPLETAELARELYAHLDAAFETLDSLRLAGLRGESVERIAHGLGMEAEHVASLPAFLFGEKESHILRRAQPIPISQVWQTLVRLKPHVDANLETLEEWRRALDDLGGQLTAMRFAVANADNHLTEANAQLDLTELADTWHMIQASAEEVERRLRTPTPEDLADFDEVSAIAEQANTLVAQLATLEALRLSLNARLAENQHRLEEVERQLRQLAESSRYPLDRVPFQAELDRLRARLTAIKDVGQPRKPERLESDLATLQVLDRQMQALVERVTAVREDRRRLIALLEDPRSATTGHGGAEQVDWLTWARDLATETSAYARECWQGEDALRIATLRDDAEALDSRRRRWMPARVDDLLAPETLARQVREVTAVRDDIETLQNRLDQVTVWLQRVRETEAKARSTLQTVYGPLDRLEIVAADLLPPELTEEDNHWTRVRKHLDAGYGLDLALDNRGAGSVLDKAERVTAWVEACAATLNDWHLTLLAETQTAMEAVSRDLDDVSTIARLDSAVAIQRAEEVLKLWETSTHKRWERVERSGGSLPDTCRELAAEVGEELRMLARLDEVAMALDADIFTPIGEPVSLWQEAQRQAELDFSRLKALEEQSRRSWPPVSCDVIVLQPEFELAEGLQHQLHRENTTVTQVVAAADQLAHLYGRISALIAERERAYHAHRPKLDGLLDRLEHWRSDLKAYGKQHNTNPVVASAIRARIDEIEASLTQLHIDYGQGQELVPGDEALRVLEALWRQATRDVPVGAGMNVIPMDWIGRPH